MLFRYNSKAYGEHIHNISHWHMSGIKAWVEKNAEESLTFNSHWHTRPVQGELIAGQPCQRIKTPHERYESAGFSSLQYPKWFALLVSCQPFTWISSYWSEHQRRKHHDVERWALSFHPTGTHKHPRHFTRPERWSILKISLETLVSGEFSVKRQKTAGNTDDRLIVY